MSLTSSTSVQEPVRHTIDQLALNMGFGGMRPVAANPPNLSPTSFTSSSSLINATNSGSPSPLTPTSSQLKFEPVDDISLNTEFSNETDTGVKERFITKIDPVDMTAKPAVINVPQDPVRRAAVLLAGPKFELKVNKLPVDKLTVNTDTIYSVAVSIIITT
jgi:hypothetical protein